MVTLLRLNSLFETLSTVARLQTILRTEDSQGRVRAALFNIYLNCYYFFGCLFVFCNRLFCCCLCLLIFKFYYINVTFFLIPNHLLCLPHVNKHISGLNRSALPGIKFCRMYVRICSELTLTCLVVARLIFLVKSVVSFGLSN